MNMGRGLIVVTIILLLNHPTFAQNSGSPDLLPENILSANIKSLDGVSFSLAEMKGQVSIILLWASWCSPCRFAADGLNEVYGDYAQRNVEIIGLTTENPKSDRGSVRKFVRVNKIRFKIGWIDGALAKTIAGDRDVIPQILVITNDGRVVKRFIGYNPIPQKTLAELGEIVDQYSNEQK